jgi:thymidylate synthase (FAD)
MNLTLNYYTQWYWKTDLHNLFNFLSLRVDSHAQYEIRVYADAMLDTVRRWVPIATEAFSDYRLGGVSLSSAGLEVVKKMLGGEEVNQSNSGLSIREWRELMESLGKPM